MKWYKVLLYVLMFIVCFPIIVVAFVFIAFIFPFASLAEAVQYRRSDYYKQFHIPYKSNVTYSPQYVFYKGVRQRDLFVQCVFHRDTSRSYFLYGGDLYIFPDFDFLSFDENGKCMIVRRGKYDEKDSSMEFDQWLQFRIALLDGGLTADFTVKVLFDCSLFDETFTVGRVLPESIVLTAGYLHAFDPRYQCVEPFVPRNARQLYEMLESVPDLGGKYSVDGDTLVWNFDGFTLYVYVDSECVLEFFACIGGKSYSTHWHSADSEIFTLLLELGKKGNAVVFRKPFADSLKLLYFGDKCGCKYSADKIKGRGRYITVE